MSAIFAGVADVPTPPAGVEGGARALFFQLKDKLTPVYNKLGAALEVRKLFNVLNDDAKTAKEKLLAVVQQIDANQRGKGFGFVELPNDANFTELVSNASEAVAHEAVDLLRREVAAKLAGVFLDP